MENMPSWARKANKILDFYEKEDGRVYFTIGSEDTANDVLATLAFIQPDAERRDIMFEFMAKQAIEKYDALSGREITVDLGDIGVNDQASIRKTIVFGNEPTLGDVKEAFEAVYGVENVTKKIRKLTADLINDKFFVDVEFIVESYNEITTAQPDMIALEMQQLTRLYGDKGDDATPKIEQI